MQSYILKGIVKIFTSFSNLNTLSKNLLKYGIQAFFLLLILGTVLVIVNHSTVNFDSYSEFIATSIIKSSFTILAEVVIGSLVIDFVFKK